MTKTFTINYPNLVSLCNRLSIEDPERTKTDLDLLRKNIETTNWGAAYNGIIPVEINYRDMEITLLGEPFPDSFVTMDNSDCISYEERLITHLTNAIEVTEELYTKEVVFKEINF